MEMKTNEKWFSVTIIRADPSGSIVRDFDADIGAFIAACANNDGLR